MDSDSSGFNNQNQPPIITSETKDSRANRWRRPVLVLVALLIIAGIAYFALVPKTQGSTSVPTTAPPSSTTSTATSQPTSSSSTTIPTNIIFPLIFGVNVHQSYPQIDYALAHGVDYMRTGLFLNQQQEALDENETMQDANYLGIVGDVNSSWNLSEWNSTLAQEIKAYPEIKDIEVLNEPWSPGFQSGFNNGSAHNYYLIIKSTYLITKSIDPNATIVCFGGAPINNQSVFEWYKAVWNYGAAQYCDAISIHAYPNNGNLLNTTLAKGYTVADNWTYGLGEYENLTGKPIWITETGEPSAILSLPDATRVSLTNQSTYLNQSFRFFASYPYVKRVYWYDIYGVSDVPIDRDFGLLNRTTSLPNPSWYSFLYFYNSSASK